MTPEQYERYLEDPAALRLVAEVCLPGASAAEGVRGVAISAITNDGTTRGDSLGHAYAAGATAKGQRVFLITFIERPQGVTAIAVRHDLINVEADEFWYTVPRAVPSNGFSAWQAPVRAQRMGKRIAGDTDFLLLLNGGRLSPGAVPELAPKLRFTALTSAAQSSYFDAVVVKKARSGVVPGC